MRRSLEARRNPGTSGRARVLPGDKVLAAMRGTGVSPQSSVPMVCQVTRKWPKSVMPTREKVNCKRRIQTLLQTE
jgi:hypothetical protein